MVTDSGASLRPDRLRRLGEPEPLDVRVDRIGRPIALVWKGRRAVIQKIQDVWRVDDEWWRKEISRLYFVVALADGRLCTIFRDLLAADLRLAWFIQVAAPTRPAMPTVRVLVPSEVQPTSTETSAEQEEEEGHAVA